MILHAALGAGHGLHVTFVVDQVDPGPVTILLADADADARAMYRLALEHAGYRVIEAVDGVELVRRATAERPDLVLSELLLPGQDGLEAAATLRATNVMARTKLVLLTTCDPDLAGERAAATRLDGWWLKPMTPRSLVEQVRRIAGPARRPRPGARVNGRLWAPTIR